MATSPAGREEPRPHYTDATESAFRRALANLATTLPRHHDALTALLDAGQFDSVSAIVAILDDEAAR